MKTVGQILREKRLKQKKTLAAVAQATRIQTKYLKAIEKGAFNQLPQATFVKGFIQNYAQALKINPQQVLAVFRRDYDQDKKGQIIPRSFNKRFTPSQFHLTPTKITVFLALCLIIGFFIYLLVQINQLRQPPPIQITSPQEHQAVISPLTIQGTTSPDATLSINNQTVFIKADGSFTHALSLTEGEHTITLKATNQRSQTKTVQLNVIVVSP